MPNTFKMHLVSIGAAALFALASPIAPTFAQTDTPAAASDIEPQQVQLTGPQVEKFLASWPDLEALRAKFDKKFGAANGEEEEGDPLFALGTYLDKPEAKAEIDKTLAKYGFGSFADWANVAQSVMLAFGSADPQGGPMDLDVEKKRVIEEIKADKNLTESDKQQALKDLDEQFAALADFQPLPGNVDVVKPFVDKVRELFDQQPQP